MFRSMHRISVLLIVVSVMALVFQVQPALAWQVSQAFGHNNRYGGEADSGNLVGQIELPSGYRYMRAGGEYVKWTPAEVSWIASNRNSTDAPAMVFHAFQLSSDDCGSFRSPGANGSWNWSDLPSTYIWGKATCGSGNANEIRFIVPGTIVAGTNYYYQSLFRDESYPGTWAFGRVTTDSYWDRNYYFTHDGIYKDYHAKFCTQAVGSVQTCP